MDDKEKQSTSRRGLWLFLAGFVLGAVGVGGASVLAMGSSLIEVGKDDANLVHGLMTCKTAFYGRVTEIQATKASRVDDLYLLLTAAVDARNSCEDGVATMYRGAPKK